ncbi:MAG: hypothetical protein ACM31P_02030 [Actinomycetota bacterium]
MRLSVPSGILGVLVSFFILLSAVRIGAADLLYGHAREELATWTPGAAGGASLDRISRGLDLAGRLSPDDPDRYEGLARLALTRAGQPGASPEERAGLLRQGLAAIREAVALRPGSAYGWAIELLVKKELGEHDEAFRRALRMTARLGPWEPELQRIVVDAGLEAWTDLPEAEQAVVMQVLLHGMKRQPSAMRAIAEKHAPRCGGGEGNCPR